ncbi:MupA/Atu3671 family FMN-dependent luciferase-like monooxygenase [Roseinatronobacter sp. NSM]|uniref:MupA/Atu3671 family FMN-dependent luciferase-like monooxygenase n=1 Tax=Roseinatronobacter sp. NSM TaxID=3457785 RepID=UPI0040366AAD
MQFSSVVIGDESLLAECSNQLLARGHTIAAVVTNNPNLAGWAQDNTIPVISAGHNLADRLNTLQFDWILNIAGLHVLPRAVLALPARGAINFHDGPLPQHAGLNAPVWALLAGEQQHGITWHMITETIDQGDILARAAFDIAADDTALTLNAKCFAAGVESFAHVLDMLETGQVSGQPQDVTGRNLHLRHDRPAHDGLLDFTRPAAELERLVRALDHGPYWNPLCAPKLRLGAQLVCIGAARMVDGQGQPGQVLDVDSDSVTVMCADMALRVSGLLCVQGLPTSAMHQVTPGDMLPMPPDGVTPAMTRIVAGDQRWRDALRAMVAPPPLVAQSATRDSLALDMALAPDAQTIAAFGAAVARHFGLSSVDIAWRNGAIAQAQAQATAPDHISGWVPVQVNMHSANPVADVESRLKLAQTAPGFARDISARDPMLGLIDMPPVAVTHGAEAPEAALVLDLDAGALRYDPATLSATEAGKISALLATPPPTVLDLDQFNATARAYDRICIHHAFEAQVQKTPDAVALAFENQTLTYADLNARANRVAHVLVQMGVTPDTPVALCTARGPNLLIGALGILKAGGAYVPLDPAYPSDRLAHYLSDSAAPVVVTEHALLDMLPDHAAALLQLDTDARLAAAPDTNPDSRATPDNLAYLIYTSGSTGTPKGVMVEHGNVANFFAGMDERIRHDPPGVWLAVTSLSFDISVLELFWTLARGFKIVLMGDEDRTAVSRAPVRVSNKPMDFSLMYWGNDDGQGPQKYRLLLEGAKFADTHGFCAVWTPERHFHAFGGPFPNPSVSGAAVAAVTQNLAVRAGSCVAPLHHPVRIAEEWAMIDNLTNGRTGLGIASGWHPVDFVLRPENRPPNNKQAMFDMIDTLRKLWRGDVVEFDKGDGVVPVQTLPRPVSRELPIWLTTAGNPETWRDAGRLGANVLTHLLGQSISEVAEKITIYHAALRDAGHDPADFTVTLMLHSFVARDRDHAREVARAPMKSYLLAAAALVKQYAWAFPAFKRPQGAKNPMDIDLSTLSQDEVDGILDFAFNRYFEESGLFGTVDDCLNRVEQLKAIGVTEIACLIDYGINTDQVLEGLFPLAEVVRRANAGVDLAQDDFSIAAQIHRHKVTHLQCTPSMARMMAMNDDSRAALAQVGTILIGGEALPGALARDIAHLTGQPVQNMYGPTETTIWSTSQTTTGTDGIAGIGTPIANTQVYVLDDALHPVPPYQDGELFIGGDGVTRGYWNRAELTQERFIPNPFGAGRLYRTGDLVQRGHDGLRFMGRVDHQVKIRGHRIELGEVESALEAQPGITAAVAITREDRDGDIRLVAYYTGSPSGDLRAALAQRLPAHMLPAHFVPLAQMPLTPNKKIDRKALPAPSRMQQHAPAPAPDIAAGTDTASKIAAIWCDVLGVAQVGQGDNFFHLGGHSLLAVQAHREMRSRLNIPGLSITDLFRFPVLGELARHLDGKMRPLPPAQTLPTRADDSTPPPPDTPPSSDRVQAMARRRAMRAERAGRA